jgi:hypothetical protein
MKHLITKAYTGSDWDSVDFAVIPLPDAWVQFLNEVNQDFMAIRKKHQDNVHLVTIWADNAEFFVKDDEALPKSFLDILDSIEEDEAGVFELPEEFYKDFERPETHMGHGEVRISAFGVQFSTHGKHTTDEFWTPDVAITLLSGEIKPVKS